MKKIFTLMLGVATFVPLLVSAHVKWFAEPAGEVEPYYITDKLVLIWIGIVILVVLIGMFLEKKLSVPVWLQNKIPLWRDNAVSVANVCFGLAFMLFAYFGFVFAPNLPAEGVFGYILLALELLIGIYLIRLVNVRTAGAIIVVLFFLAMWEYGFLAMLDALEMLAIGIFIFIQGRPGKDTLWRSMNEKIMKWQKYAVPILRIGTGVNLMILALSEKIFATPLTSSFLMNYQWNFMARFGMTDHWFAFSAGMTEFLIGLMLALGLVTRVTTLALAVFLLTTLILLGPIELVGHLPHFAIAVVLLVIGSGKKI